jgi:acyl-CoA dehydrogenase
VSTERELLESSVTDLLTDRCTPEVVEAADGSWDAGLWGHLERAGLTAIGVPEEAGGSGGDLLDAAVVARRCAAFAAPVPIAPTLLVAPWLREAAGLAHRPGPAAVAGTADVTAVRGDGGWTLSGSAHRVPWGRCADSVLVLVGTPEGLALADVRERRSTRPPTPRGSRPTRSCSTAWPCRTARCARCPRTCSPPCGCGRPSRRR